MSELASHLLTLRDDPPRAGQLAARHRAEDTTVEIAEAAPCDAEAITQIERSGEIIFAERWPSADELRDGDLVTVQVSPTRAASFCDYLSALSAELDAAGETKRLMFAPWCAEPQGIHRLWAVAAARIALPSSIVIGARHDLLGIRVAQVALGFGASALVGPIEPDRSLPLAGVTRPTENTRAGLRALVEQVGLRVCARPPTN